MSVKNDKEFDAKLMNYDGDRYDIVVLASTWAKELKKKQEYKWERMPLSFISVWKKPVVICHSMTKHPRKLLNGNLK